MIGQPYFAAQVGRRDSQPAIRTRDAWVLTIVAADVQGGMPAGVSRPSASSHGSSRSHVAAAAEALEASIATPVAKAAPAHLGINPHLMRQPEQGSAA